jgi:hypothetical protein
MNLKSVISLIAGYALGFLTSMILSLLFLSWPIRTLGSVIVLGFAFLVIVWRGDKPLQKGRLSAGGFILGYGLFVAILAFLDIIFPPLT